MDGAHKAPKGAKAFDRLFDNLALRRVGSLKLSAANETGKAANAALGRTALSAAQIGRLFRAMKWAPFAAASGMKRQKRAKGEIESGRLLPA